MDPELFPEVSEDITGLTDEQLDELIASYEQGMISAITGEAFSSMENPPDRNERRDIMLAAKDTLLRLRAEKEDRATEEAEFSGEIAEIAEAAGVEVPAALAAEDEPEPEPEPTPEGEGEPEALAAEGETPAEGEALGEPEGTEGEPGEALAASGAPEPRVYRRPPAAPRRHQPIAVGNEGAVLTASAGVEGFREGAPLDREGLAKITAEAIRRHIATPPGFSQPVVLASADWSDQYPKERVLDGESWQTDTEKLRQIRGRETLLASGGYCAPSVIRYDVGALGTQSRPVRDALTAFNATRGGVEYLPDLSIATTDTTDGISRITEAEDEAGGTLATKTCVTIDCPDFTDIRADVIATCLQAGNLMEMAFPELVAAWQDLLGVAAARERDGGLLDAIAADAQTKTVTAAKVYGTLPSVVYAFNRLAAGYRSRHRLDADVVLRALAPAWLADELVVDCVNRTFADFDAPITRANVAALIRAYTSVDLTWYLDSATGASQVFGAQSENVEILKFPGVAYVYLYPEGGIGFLDQGQLNIGLVRDSVLNETNDVRFFAEVFENAFVIAAEVFEAKLTICPTGEAAPTGTVLSCS